MGIWLLNGFSILQTGDVATFPLNWGIVNANAD